MRKEFDEERFDLVDGDRVHIADLRFGHGRHGDLDVWTVRGESGVAFVRQITVGGTAGPTSQGVYALECVIMREKATGRFFFLERDDRGFTLQTHEFFGAEAFLGAEAAKVETWLAGRTPALAAGDARGDGGRREETATLR